MRENYHNRHSGPRTRASQFAALVMLGLTVVLVAVIFIEAL